MAFRRKRGQYFLFAALVLVSIIFSLGSIYNYATTSVQDSKTNSLAEEIKFESFQIINQGFYNNLSIENITYNIKNLSYYYSKENPTYNLTIVFGDSSNLEAYTYHFGASNSQVVTQTSNNVTLSLNTISYLFNKTKGYNLFVIVGEENGKERSVATA